jgi:hypothetical protein
MYVYWKTIFSTLLVLKLGLIELTNGTAIEFVRTTEHIGVETKYGECICPLSCSVHCNFVRVGNYSERGWACTSHPHHPGLIFPS